MKNLFSKSFERKKLAVSITSLVVFIAAMGIIFYHGTKKTVALTLNGQHKVVRTHATTINDILKDLEITVHAEDYLYPKADTKIKDNLKVVWKSAKQVELNEGQKTKNVWTTAATVGELLKEQKVVLSRKDKVSPTLKEPLKNGMEIQVEKAFPLTVEIGGNKSEVWSTSTTVADFLGQQGIKLNELDRVEPQKHEHIKPKDTVRVVRVEKVTDVVEEPVNFAVITKKDANLKMGTQKVMTQGQNGIISKQFEVIRENGKDVTRKLIVQKTIRNKKDKVVAVGTKTFVAQVSRGQQEGASSGNEFYVNSTAYTASCNGCSGFTSTGINLKSNPTIKVIAVDPRVIPLGSKVYVEGYGYAVAADKGSAIRGYKIDVFFASRSDAYRWGVRKIKIRVLN